MGVSPKFLSRRYNADIPSLMQEFYIQGDVNEKKILSYGRSQPDDNHYKA